jgi:hypothetical protein
MGGIFINYRRGETAGEARALFIELSAQLGAESVFMDVDNIALGRDFRDVLQERLASVDVMLTLIGKDWSRAADAAGRRRLDDPNDFVRREIHAALARDIAVTPVLLQGAQMPAEAELPADIRDLAYRNAFELSHARWSSDVHELVKRLGLSKPVANEPQAPQPVVRTLPAAASVAAPAVAATGTGRTGRAVLLAVFATVLVAGASGYFYYRQVDEEHAKQLRARAEADSRQRQIEAELVAARADAASVAAAKAGGERKAREDAALLAAKDRALVEQHARQEAEQTRTERAVADQLARQRAAEQAAKELAAKDQAAREQAELKERARLAELEQTRRREDLLKGKFSGSLTVSLGDFANLQGTPSTDVTATSVKAACGKWSQQVLPGDAQTFLSVCLSLPSYASQNALRLGTRATQQEWMIYCSQRATAMNVTGDDRRSMMGACLRYR